RSFSISASVQSGMLTTTRRVERGRATAAADPGAAASPAAPAKKTSAAATARRGTMFAAAAIFSSGREDGNAAAIAKSFTCSDLKNCLRVGYETACHAAHGRETVD